MSWDKSSADFLIIFSNPRKCRKTHFYEHGSLLRCWNILRSGMGVRHISGKTRLVLTSFVLALSSISPLTTYEADIRRENRGTAPEVYCTLQTSGSLPERRVMRSGSMCPAALLFKESVNPYINGLDEKDFQYHYGRKRSCRDHFPENSRHSPSSGIKTRPSLPCFLRNSRSPARLTVA